MTDFEVWKEAFARVGVDLDEHKRDDYLYENEDLDSGDSFKTDKLSVGGYYGWQFSMILNEDGSIKKLEMRSSY